MEKHGNVSFKLGNHLSMVLHVAQYKKTANLDMEFEFEISFIVASSAMQRLNQLLMVKKNGVTGKTTA